MYELVAHGGTATSGTIGTTSGSTSQIDILGLVSGGASVSSNILDFGEFAVSSALTTGSAAAVTGNLTFAPSTAFNSSVNGQSTTNVPTPAASTSSSVGVQVGNPANIDGSNNTTVVLDLGTATSTTAPSSVVTVNGIQYNSFNLGTLTFTTSAAAASGASTTISVVPRTTTGIVVEPHKAFISSTFSTFNTADGSSFALNAAAVATLVGDVNGDGIVNQLDLNIINGHWQATGVGFANGDINGDGIVNQLDLNLVNGNWQAHLAELESSSSLSLAAVPEPVSMGLLAVGGSIAMLKRRRRA